VTATIRVIAKEYVTGSGVEGIHVRRHTNSQIGVSQSNE